MNDIAEITPKTVISQSKDQVSTDLDNETVLMSIEQGNYYGMDQILSRIWAIIENPVKTSDLIEKLLEEYDISREDCEKDVLKVLNELAKENLLVIN